MVTTRISTNDYSGRVADQRLLQRAIVMQKWLVRPGIRLMLPRRKRAEMLELVRALAARLAPAVDPFDPVEAPLVEHLTHRPARGSSVRLLTDSWYLREQVGARRGSIGTVLDHSQNHREDTGVLVDWGNGRRIRSSLTELAPWPHPGSGPEEDPESITADEPALTR